MRSSSSKPVAPCDELLALGSVPVAINAVISFAIPPPIPAGR